jgi:chromosome segregation ATPase
MTQLGWMKNADIETLTSTLDEIQKKHTELSDKHSELLQQHTDLSNRHSELLDEHTDLQGKHSEVSEKHSEILTKHSELTDEHAALTEKHTELLAQHSDLIDKHSAISENQSDQASVDIRNQMKELELEIEQSKSQISNFVKFLSFFLTKEVQIWQGHYLGIQDMIHKIGLEEAIDPFELSNPFLDKEVTEIQLLLNDYMQQISESEVKTESRNEIDEFCKVIQANADKIRDVLEQCVDDIHVAAGTCSDMAEGVGARNLLGKSLLKLMNHKFYRVVSHANNSFTYNGLSTS